MIKKIDCHLNCGLPAQDVTKIIVHGAQEHNLKNICFAIPKGKLVALTGPSGSGKSSIATDILQKECIRQYLESLGMTTDHIAIAKVDNISGLSPSIGVSQRVADYNPRSTVGTKTGILTILRNMFAALGRQPCNGCGSIVKQPLQNKHKLTMIEVVEQADSTKKRKHHYFDCPQCGYQLEKLQMAHFSCNASIGACESCKGVGEIIDVDKARLLHEEKTIRTGAVDCWNESLARYYENIILVASKYYGFPLDTTLPLRDYTDEQRNFLLYGVTSPDFTRAYAHIPAPKKVSEGNFEGIIPQLLDLYKKNPEKAADSVKKYIVNTSCAACNGTRLARLGRVVTINGKTITDIAELDLYALLAWLQHVETLVTHDELPVFTAVAGALKKRIENLIEVGLHYLTLNRTIPSLSAGESQRLRLASLLGSGLTGVLYVLDEPTTGLHPYNTAQLLTTVRKIQEAGNTVLIIEHDMDVVKQADYILDIGPAGGSTGGTVVACGTPADIMACATSSTGNYLAHKSILSSHSPARDTGKELVIYGAREHNLRNLDVRIPLQQFVVLTGVSGSGKSTFLFDIVDKAARRYLYQASAVPGKHTAIEGLDHIKRVVTVDQTTIGSKSSRSNVATYTKLFDLIRDLFASLPESKSRGFTAATFSFNTSEERCENCNGAGVVEIDMTFMPDIETECPVCNGMRFSEVLLAVQFQGHHISSILDMTVSEALVLFKHEKKISTILDLMRQVGLEYVRLGQSTATLSGGEAQRIKLAAELSKSSVGNTLYLLDEPTTGLHPQEVATLIDILKALVSQGNTVITIEHNLDLICAADTIIDFGPGGGNAGGTIVATGTPQEIMAHQESLTGQSIKAYCL